MYTRIVCSSILKHLYSYLLELQSWSTTLHYNTIFKWIREKKRIFWVLISEMVNILHEQLFFPQYFSIVITLNHRGTMCNTVLWLGIKKFNLRGSNFKRCFCLYVYSKRMIGMCNGFKNMGRPSNLILKFKMQRGQKGQRKMSKRSAAGYFCMVERYHSLFLAVILK